MKLLLVAVVVCLYAGCASGRRRVKTNNPVTVSRGRSVFLSQRSDLQIEYEDGDVCNLVVLRNNPTEQLIGALTTNGFPCNYPDDTIEYVHFGALSPQTDRVALQAVIHSATETIILPVTLQINVAFIQLEIVNNNRPLTVPRPGGTSDPIDSSKLSFMYDSSTTECRLTLLVQPDGLPRYGELLNTETNGFMQDCQEFLDAGVRYRHTRPPSPDRDNIPVLVELKDKDTKALIKKEYFQVLVRIRNAQSNQSPTRSLAALYVLEVHQFVLTAITQDIIAAEDAETPAGELIFNITQPLEPGQGFIVSTDDRDLPLQAFKQQDVLDLKIAYSPPTEDADVRRIFEVSFEVVDSEGEVSDEFAVVIIVNPKNTLAPLATRNKGLTLFEGQSRAFTRHVLMISDEDNVQDVVITAINGPHHGTLFKDDGEGNVEETRTFTVHDLKQGVFIYHHDGSDTYSDNIVFHISDGRNDVNFLFPITVSPTDDEYPRLTANVLLRLKEGETVPITVFHLSATDVDSQISSVTFVLEATHLPQAGQLLYRQREVPDPLTGFTFVDGYYEKPISSFTQQDIADGRIFYRHDGSESFQDEFRFKVQDGHTPPNKSPVHSFKIKLQREDDLTPSLVPGKPLKMDVDEGRVKVLLSDYVLYTDIDTDDDDLIYTITDGPTLVGESGHAGTLVLTDNPTQVVTTFTQKQLKHGKITYKPPIGEQGTRTKQVEFTFSVADPAGNTLTGQKFIITLNPMDEMPPTVRSDIVPTLGEGKIVVIGRQFLGVYDPDTDPSDIVYIVKSIPENGGIYRNGVPLRVGDRFTLDDVDNGRITYVHTGSETTTDHFQLTVTDGKNNQTFTVRPQIIPRDDTTPVLVHARPMTVNENGISSLTQEILRTTDIDTNDLRLRYIVVQAPRKGEIRVNGSVANSFTQLDILNGLVMYIHTGGEIGVSQTTDSFVLNVTDDSTEVPGGNILGGIVMNITILPVDNQPPVVSVTPGFTVIEGGRSRITFDNLTVSDPDTDIGSIICRITSLPNEGYVENQAPVEGGEKSRRGKPINTFTIRNVLDGYIYYVQDDDSDDSEEPALDRFTIVCGDIGNNKAEPINFDIVVEANNDEPPKIFVEAFIVDEGGVLPIRATRLRATDGDIPAQTLTFVITKQPDYGQIVEQRLAGNVRISSFTMDQITDGVIFYIHDDTETTSDTFSVVLTDGKYEVPRTITITILPVDDETPRLKHNRGLNLVELGGHDFIRKRLLTATDIDTQDETLMYLLRVVPRMGYLQLLVGSSWHNLTVNENFTQAHINTNKVRFLSNGKDGGRDRFKFDMTDGVNTFSDREFIINIPDVDGTPPVLRIRPIVVRENGLVVISTDYLHAMDQNSQDQNIKYTMLEAPKYGRLENSDRPGIPVVMFTQLDLAGNKIRYIHTSDGEEPMDTIEIRASDSVNDVLGTLIFMITGTDDALPVLFNNGLTLDEGASKWVTPFELRAEDADTEPNKIVFTITQEPMHGKLRRKGKHVREFTQLDIDENFITYEHDGSDSTEDEAQFTVSDSTNREFFASASSTSPTRRSQTFLIFVNPIDDMLPKVDVLRPVGDLFGGGGGSDGSPGGNPFFPISSVGYCFSPDGLRVVDPDSDDTQLRFIIVEQPQFGHIRNIGIGNASVTEFTQADINARQACYILTNRNASSDSFTFKVVDPAGNVLSNQRLRLDWSYVYFASARYEVSESAGYLQVHLRRRGDVNSNAFVTIRAIAGTAEKGVDFNPGPSHQVNFAPGVSEKTWRVEIINDNQYERIENFRVELSDPVSTVLDEPSRTIVTIIDQDDEPSLSFGVAKYIVEEDVGELLIPVYRSGDSILETSVICATVPITATGTTPFTVESKSDYITRPESAQSSVIEFLEGETEKACRILIIDDSLNEEDETFSVNLLSMAGSKIGQINEAEVTIRVDDSDVPIFRFAKQEYRVDESDDYVTVTVLREGTDFTQPASVQIATARSKPESAKPGLDYIPVSKMLEFAPGVIESKVDITIVDDTNFPVLEGIETFQTRLLMAQNAIVGSPNRAVVYINDTVSDRPQFRFRDKTVVVRENDGTISVVVVRTGDVSKEATVRCYTRQASAQVMMDFGERPNSDVSLITFKPGERTKTCTVELMDDTLEEEDEMFRLHLSEADSPDVGGATIGKPHTVEITVKDDGDKPIIQFKDTRVLVQEPATAGDIVYANLTILRLGDISQLSVVTVYTEDTIAEAGTDYLPFSKRLQFVSNMSQAIVSIGVLGDSVAENLRESFKVRIGNDEKGRALIRKATAHVFIDDASTGNGQSPAGYVDPFPLPPEVVSLEDYDDAGNAGEPDPGYPVVCITSCNPRHSRYAESGPLCNVDDTKTRYQWKTAAKDTDLVKLTSGTFFADVDAMVLDSVFLSPGGRVQCTAIPVAEIGGQEVSGIPSDSDVVSVSQEDGPCPRYDDDVLGAEPFSTQVSYMGPTDPNFPNMVKIVIRVPHYNGLLPVISTQQPTNYDLLFTKSGFRTGSHPCSNLLMPKEYTTKTNFITQDTDNDLAQGDILAYQYDTKMRSAPTLQFYRSLDLRKCLWTFESYYNMSEVVDTCGGTVNTDDSIRDNTQSHLDVTLPLHIGFAYYSPSNPNRWTTFRQDTTAKMSFVYDTQVLWKNGITTVDAPQPGDQGIGGSLQPGQSGSSIHPQRIYIQDNKLRVTFRSKAGFRGQFILAQGGENSMVMSKNYPIRQFNLELLHSPTTVVSAEQVWRFSSQLALADYTDTYVIKLVPCVVPQGVGFSSNLNCNPGDKMTFELPIRFQQTSNPVGAQYTLSTQFYIVNKETTWLMDSTADFGADIDQVFAPNSQIYGRLQVDPSQSLGSGYNLNLEKVWVCAGQEGYTPRYDPDNGHYGCIRNSQDLLYTRKIIDTREPDTVGENLNDVSFNARLASQVTDASAITSNSNVDGFVFDVAPLYSTGANADNFVHALYRMSGSNRRRSVVHAVQSPRTKREANGQLDDGEGTGMQMIRLIPQSESEGPGVIEDGVIPDERNPNNAANTPEEDGSGTPLIPIIAAVAGVLVVVLLIVVIVVISRRRSSRAREEKSDNSPPSYTSTVAIPPKVAAPPDDDNTEV